jgi:hypothetical protein
MGAEILPKSAQDGHMDWNSLYLSLDSPSSHSIDPGTRHLAGTCIPAYGGRVEPPRLRVIGAGVDRSILLVLSP